MKKILKNRIFIVIVTLIIGISGTLYATNIYKAEEVLYNTSDGKSMSVSEALNDLYSTKESAIKKYEFNTYNVTYEGDLTFSDTKWVKADKETRKCTGSGDNQECDFANTGGEFTTTLSNFKPSKILGGYVCFNVFNGIYDSGIRFRRGYSVNNDSTASILYTYYNNGICVALDWSSSNKANATGHTSVNGTSFKNDNEKYGVSFANSIYARVTDAKVMFSFYVGQNSNYNGNYSSGSSESLYEIKGTSYEMWGKIYYE